METEICIGAGGWAYFDVPGDRLRSYARAFDIVEVNSTFYWLPSPRTAMGWRRRVPPDFEFTVRCHRSLTHTLRLTPSEESFEIYEQMRDVCRALDAEVLHLTTPASLRMTPQRLEEVRDFLRSADRRGLRLAWEVRNGEQPGYEQLLALLHDNGVIHSVDLSVELPAYSSEFSYSRLFGRGRHNIYQFTDEELRDVSEKARKSGSAKSVLIFHGIRMYKDAARIKVYESTGAFPRVTGSVGLDSLAEVLREDARFPCTKSELVSHQGWKVIDLTPQRRIKASALLQRLPDRAFAGISEVVQGLEGLGLTEF